MESVAGLPWNQWQLCRGIGGNFAVEYAGNNIREDGQGSPSVYSVVLQGVLWCGDVCTVHDYVTSFV